MEICNNILDTEDDKENKVRFTCDLEKGHRSFHVSGNTAGNRNHTTLWD